jgi:hypothetical protein
MKALGVPRVRLPVSLVLLPEFVDQRKPGVPNRCVLSALAQAGKLRHERAVGVDPAQRHDRVHAKRIRAFGQAAASL